MKYDREFWGQMKEAALLYKKDTDREYSNTLASVYLVKYRGTVVLAIAVGPSAVSKKGGTIDGDGETGQSLF